MKKEKTIYDLELNESIDVNGHTVHRVPGGWIYMTYNYGKVSSVFVPFDNEFQNK